MSKLSTTIFLDRDGVIIENRREYVRSVRDVKFIPRSLQALKSISDSDHKIIIVTNQSAVGRGIITMDDAIAINERIIEIIQEEGGRVDRLFMCPHSPEAGCDCRKPAPGLLLNAMEQENIDMTGSFLVGDAITDIQAGIRAGVGNLALVMTGRGREQLNQEPILNHPFSVFNDLHEVIETWFR